MNDINTLTITGRIVKEPETKAIGDKTICTFTLANNGSKKVNGEWKEDASFFDCTVFGNTAIYAAKLNKGTLVCISGSMRCEYWISKDGVKKSRWRVTVDRIVSMNKIKENNHQNTESDETSDTVAEIVNNILDQEIPF